MPGKEAGALKPDPAGKEGAGLIIDTHTHYALPMYREDLELVKREDVKAGISQVLCLPITYEDHFSLLDAAEKYPGMLFSVGIHPLHVPINPEIRYPSYAVGLKEGIALAEEKKKVFGTFRDRMQALEQMIAEHPDKIAAVGETGIDCHTETAAANLQMQMISFREHIYLSLRHKLPLVLHLRGEGAFSSALSVLNAGNFRKTSLRGVVHCFHGSREEMEMVQAGGKNDFLFGIGGMITYPAYGAQLRETLAGFPSKEDILSKLVLETDSPFLPPQAVMDRAAGEAGGKLSGETIADKRKNVRNISANLNEVIEVLSQVLKVSGDEVISRTAENARRMFGFA